jgi:hypothetical protein
MKCTLTPIILITILIAPKLSGEQNSTNINNDSMLVSKNADENRIPPELEKEFGIGRLKFVDLTKGGKPIQLYGDLNLGIASEEPIEKCFQFFEIHKVLYGLINPRAELLHYETETWKGLVSTLKFYQIHNGIKVEHAQIFVHFDRNGELDGTDGLINLDIRSVDTNPAISKELAQEIATVNYTGLKFVGFKVPEPELIIHSRGDNHYLCWIVTPGIELKYYIDAHSGKILDSASEWIKN